MNELLKQLTEADGVAGFEHEVRSLIRDLIEDHVARWHVDAMGNLIAVKQGTGDDGMRVMVDAHMDEVGLLVTSVERNGTCKFVKVGGIDDRTLLGKAVSVGPDKLPGAIGARPIHLLKPGQRSTVVALDAMRIDIGAAGRVQAARKVKVGDPVAFITPYEEQGAVAFGKAFDNRAGCAALIELLRSEPFAFDLYATFTVQEEVGLRGAGTAAFGVEPDVAFVLECTPAYDLPTERDISPNVSLGKGPSVYVMDARAIQDPRLVRHITRTAAAHGIPFQIRQPGGGGTNTGAIQRSRRPVPAATIAVPARYTHTPVSMIDLRDYRHVVALTDAALRNLTLDVFSVRPD
jgi:tetrahedral aminopeptidase